ncbi:MAG: hypothetical protein RL376_1281, partial [Verrucomicrobiota bacterium]
MNLNASSALLRPLAGLCLLGASVAHAQEPAPTASPVPAAAPAATLKTLALAGVKVSPAVLSSAAGAARKNSLDRMSQALDGQ